MLRFEIVAIDTTCIADWDGFHDTFGRAFGFPAFYGGNMDAWIDCMSYLDDPESGMSKVHAPDSGVVVLELKGMKSFRERCPEIANAVEECAAFVNWRRIEQGGPPVLVLSYNE